jgi:RNA polymerase sigma-70 factor (ECF subfamily)
MANSDSELLERARSGDRDALVALLEQHGPAVRRRIAGRIPRRWRSVLSDDDVMQQTYADAVLGIGRFEPRGEGAFAAWMIRLAECNLFGALRMLRARKRGGDRHRVEPPSGGEFTPALEELLATSSGTPSRKVALHEATSTLTSTLDKLPPVYRRVIELYDLEQRPIDDVAHRLERSQGAVYMLRARAHERLAETMGRASNYFSDVP